jgi:DMSO reductase anchor subunit
MHPALSVIVFTVSSGIGYGMLFWLAVNTGLDDLPIPGIARWQADIWFGVAAFGLAFMAIAAGLLSSTLHLGHPERAWRALSQWRSSWLSREGVMAIVTFVPTGLFAIGWVLAGDISGWWLAAGVAGALCCLLTVYCTAMIYASLKPIAAWNNGFVPATYIVLSLASGAVWLAAIARIAGMPPGNSNFAIIGLLAMGAVLKIGYWFHIDRNDANRAATGSAIGLPGQTARPLDPPNTQSNYLQKEMGFVVARRHATRLRRIAILLVFLVPLTAWFAMLWLSQPMQAASMTLAAIAMTAGLLIERWLFFAEAKHSVMLYYRGD